MRSHNVVSQLCSSMQHDTHTFLFQELVTVPSVRGNGHGAGGGAGQLGGGGFTSKTNPHKHDTTPLCQTLLVCVCPQTNVATL